MNLKLLQGYTLAILCVLVLAAAGFLLLNNIGGEWEMQVFWRPVKMGPAAWLLLAALGGVVLWWTLTKLLPMAISSLKAGAKLRRQKDADQQLRQLTSRQKEEKGQ